ncbi:MAG: type II toxin-antitoxin system Phd/YefM family antitoxin [Ornithinimicrobium sp.]|uniref:type II toxin-antitoxin system Phd/YefM family antitoxin n=1 Tax=Ornithinimicrobium sp. TaxID=1977084 RepID=UPI003D9B5774
MSVGELRQHAAALVRRVHCGEQIEITVSGRPAARLVPCWSAAVAPLCAENAGAFAGAPDPYWQRDRDLIDPSLGVDPQCCSPSRSS